MWVLAALLVINLLLVAYVILRVPSAAEDLPPQVDTRTETATAPARESFTGAAERSVTAASAPATPKLTGAARPVAPPPAAASPASAPAGVSAPSRDDLLARGTQVPASELNMHVYDANPAARFILLNGQRLRESETSAEGLLVERITPEGVILRFGNASFAVNLQ